MRKEAQIDARSDFENSGNGGILPPPQLERLLELIEVKVEAFAVCEIENGCGLRCEALDMTILHFVLAGHGSIEWSGGAIPIEPGAMIVIPKRLPKQINGAGPVRRVIDADDACPLADGLVRFRAVNTDADLVLGCGSLVATLGDGPSLLDGLTAPVREQVDDDVLSFLFRAMLAELSSAGVGTRALISTIMKQIMMLLLRSHLGRPESRCQFPLSLIDARLMQVVTVITDDPGAPHTLDSLARVAGMSRSRFCEHFAAVYASSPMQFVQNARLNKAARMLETSALPTKAIASAVGYASRSHFSHMFRSKFGIDPSHYRNPGASISTWGGEKRG